MKTSILSAGIVLLVSVPFAYSDTVPDRTQGPCFSVNIQNDQLNESSVQQNCARNVSRTVQAGSQNWAQTIQTGQVNDNKVRQYLYDKSKYLARMRGN